MAEQFYNRQWQASANSKRWFPEIHARPHWDQVVHQTLGMVGESGEFANLVKKANRYNSPDVMTDEQMQAMREELADVFTYVLNLASLLNADLLAEFDRKQIICEQRWGTPSVRAALRGEA